jgi:hypothetical protein
MRKTPAAIATAVIAAGLVLAGCTSKSSGASAAKSAAASVTADPRVHAELDQAKMLVKSCFAGTPLQQAHQIHLVFLSSASGKNGPEVVAARTKLDDCLGIPQAQRTAFKNDAITAAEHQTPKIISVHPAAGVRQYLEFTLPQLVLKYKGTAAGVGTSTAQPPIPGTTAPAASVTASGSPA